MPVSRYKKCALEKPIGKFRQRQTCWLPEDLARIGFVLCSHIQQDFWDDNWLVTEVLEVAPEGFIPDSVKVWEMKYPKK